MLLLVLLVSAAAVVVLMLGTFVAQRHTGRWSVVDVTWGLGFLLVTVLAVVLGDGDGLRRLLLLGLVAVWSLRLASHIARRAGGKEDPRYEELKKRGGGFLRRVLLPQGAALFFVSLPVQVAVTSERSLGLLAWLGVAVWVLGLIFEAVGDAQLKHFKADPDNKGKVMDRGLWSWTRHPNYFGDACIWWGIWLVAADSGWLGAATVLSPVAMTAFLVFVTGAKPLERTMRDRPGFPAYAERTSMFVPLPPKGTAARQE